MTLRGWAILWFTEYRSWDGPLKWTWLEQFPIQNQPTKGSSVLQKGSQAEKTDPRHRAWNDLGKHQPDRVHPLLEALPQAPCDLQPQALTLPWHLKA